MNLISISLHSMECAYSIRVELGLGLILYYRIWILLICAIYRYARLDYTIHGSSLRQLQTSLQPLPLRISLRIPQPQVWKKCACRSFSSSCQTIATWLLLSCRAQLAVHDVNDPALIRDPASISQLTAITPGLYSRKYGNCQNKPGINFVFVSYSTFTFGTC